MQRAILATGENDDCATGRLDENAGESYGFVAMAVGCATVIMLVAAVTEANDLESPMIVTNRTA